MQFAVDAGRATSVTVPTVGQCVEAEPVVEAQSASPRRFAQEFGIEQFPRLQRLSEEILIAYGGVTATGRRSGPGHCVGIRDQSFRPLHIADGAAGHMLRLRT